MGMRRTCDVYLTARDARQIVVLILDVTESDFDATRVVSGCVEAVEAGGCKSLEVRCGDLSQKAIDRLRDKIDGGMSAPRKRNRTAKSDIESSHPAAEAGRES